MIDLSRLNSEQRQAVETTEGPVLVLSGAGTGKTTVLTTRLAYIIEKGLARSNECFCVTFTNKAAKEMQERVEKMIGAEARYVWLGTFHRLGLRILRRYAQLVGLEDNFIILDSSDQERLVKQLLQANNVDIKKWTPSAVLEAVQRFKDKGITYDKAKDYTHFLDGQLAPFYSQYQRALIQNNSVDFGDLLLYPLQILLQHPDIASVYAGQFKYILVDEYQDTNTAQYLFLRLLSMGHHNICCVGDDDQSIYSWRGAVVENILKFERDFPNSKVIRLESNYRSTTHILGAASGLISKNQSRLGKTLRVAPHRDGHGDCIEVKSYYNGTEEALSIMDKIENHHRAGIALSQMAILVRAGFQTREFEEALIKSGYPYQVIGDYRFYEREEIKDAVAYLRLLTHPTDNLSFLRVVNKPRRGIGDSSIEKLNAYATELGISLYSAIEGADLPKKAKEALLNFRENIKIWTDLKNKMHLSDLMRFVLGESGYIQMWRDDKNPQSEGKLENLSELLNVMNEGFSGIDEFLEHASLIADVDKLDDKEKITVMTLHASKGLEYDVVFLPGWEEGIFPNAKSVEEGGIEEERRLGYVGITRARKNVYISSAMARRVYGQWQNQIQSRFISEIPKEHIQSPNRPALGDYGTYRPKFIQKPKIENHVLGKRVFHETFGQGVVIRSDGDKLEVAFNKGGIKKIMKNFVKFL